MRIIKQLVGWALCVTCGPFVVMAGWDLATGGDGKTSTGVLVALLVLFGGATAGGVKLIRAARAETPRQLSVGEEREMVALRLARASGGTLGPTELATDGGMPFADARATLDALCKQGACELVVTDGGAVLYRFPDLMVPALERQNAKDVLE